MIGRPFHFLLFLACFASVAASGQQQSLPASKEPTLYQTILHMDSVMFDAFNTHNLAVLKTVFAEDLEFYHDRDGLGNYAMTINSFEAMFSRPMTIRRQLVAGTLEVYPLPGYGAVEIGTHQFTRTDNGQTMTSLYKFVNTWRYKDGQWKVTRAISVGHL